MMRCGINKPDLKLDAWKMRKPGLLKPHRFSWVLKHFKHDMLIFMASSEIYIELAPFYKSRFSSYKLKFWFEKT